MMVVYGGVRILASRSHACMPCSSLFLLLHAVNQKEKPTIRFAVIEIHDLKIPEFKIVTLMYPIAGRPLVLGGM